MDTRIRVDPRSALAASGAPSGKLVRDKVAYDPASGLLGRTAAMLHALGLAAALVAAVVAWLVGLKKDEAYTIQGVGGAAALALGLWSLCMALRALWRGEPKRWALAVAALFVLEMGALGAWQWDALTQWGGLNDAWFTWGAWIGLPAWGPALLIGAVLALPYALARGHAAERRARARGDETWTLAKRRQAALRAMGYLTALAALPVFLAALYVYSAAMHANAKGVSWQGPVVRYTPDAAKRGLNSLFTFYEGPRARNLGFALVVGGELPSDALEERLEDPSRWLRGFAWKVLCAQYPERARALTLDREAIDRAPADVQMAIAEALARDGSDAELRQAFTTLERAHAAFVTAFFKFLVSEQRTAVLPDLLECAARTQRRMLFDDAAVAVEQLTGGGSWRKYWTTMLTRTNPVTRRWAVENLLKRPVCLFRNALALDALLGDDPAGREEALVLLARNRGTEWDLARCAISNRKDGILGPLRLAEYVRAGDPLRARLAAHVLAGLEGRSMEAGPSADACLQAYLKPFDASLALPPLSHAEQAQFNVLMQEADAWMNHTKH